jgi:hypothetical protein
VLERFCQIFSQLNCARGTQRSCAKLKNDCFFVNFIFGDLVMVLILMMEVEVVVIVTREIVFDWLRTTLLVSKAVDLPFGVTIFSISVTNNNCLTNTLLEHDRQSYPSR